MYLVYYEAQGGIASRRLNPHKPYQFQMRKTYQPILNGKPFGSLVVGFKAALARRTIIVRANCRRPHRPSAYNIVETPGVSQCCSCSEYCSCRLREVRP